MRCGTLTRPQGVLLVTYLFVLFGIDALDLDNGAMAVLTVGLAMAVAILLWRGACTVAEER